MGKFIDGRGWPMAARTEEEMGRVGVPMTGSAVGDAKVTDGSRLARCSSSWPISSWNPSCTANSDDSGSVVPPEEDKVAPRVVD